MHSNLSGGMNKQSLLKNHSRFKFIYLYKSEFEKSKNLYYTVLRDLSSHVAKN